MKKIEGIKISILVPTRNRPDNLSRLIFSALGAAADPGSIEFIFYVDKDDYNSKERLQRMNDYYETIGQRLNVLIIAGERIVLSKMWNKCWEQASGDVMMHAGDDIVFKTEKWDEIVLSEFEKYPDRIVFVYGNDGNQPKTFGTHGFLHRRWANALGYFVPPYFSSDYNDTWLNEVAEKINRHVYVDILTDHLHFVYRKGPYDQTHADRCARHKEDNVDQLYIDYEPKRVEDAKKLLASIRYFEEKNSAPNEHHWGDI